MDDVESRMTFDGPRYRLNAQLPKVGHEVFLKLRASMKKVRLLSEYNYLTLNN